MYIPGFASIQKLLLTKESSYYFQIVYCNGLEFLWVTDTDLTDKSTDIPYPQQ